ncbi:ribose-phosphate pyrophosphokinase [Streptococcus pneumoniae]|nr:ribose-phosphate pyrophosphokinase [Streptococcus pneumoniae]
MLDLPAKNVTILEGSNIHVLHTHQSYKHIAPVYAIAIVDSNYFSDDLAFHSFIVK